LPSVCTRRPATTRLGAAIDWMVPVNSVSSLGDGVGLGEGVGFGDGVGLGEGVGDGPWRSATWLPCTTTLIAVTWPLWRPLTWSWESRPEPWKRSVACPDGTVVRVKRPASSVTVVSDVPITLTRRAPAVVDSTVPWVHFDLAASDRKGGLAHIPTEFTGFGVRYAVHLLGDARRLNERLQATT